MKIKLNISQIFFLKLLLESLIESENELKKEKLIAQDILNKLNK